MGCIEQRIHLVLMDTGNSDSLRRVVGEFVAEHFADALLVLDGDGRLVDCNRAARDILGPDPLATLTAAVDGGGSWSEFTSQFHEGGHTMVLIAPEAQPDFALRVEAVSIDGHAVVWVRDARRERRQQVEIERARQNDLTTQLVRRVVHDMNNILTPILGMSTLLLAALDQGSRTSQYAREIEDAAQRAVDLAREMRDFLRGGKTADVSDRREGDDATEPH